MNLRKALYGLLILTIAIYIYTVFGMEADSAAATYYHLTGAQLQLINLTIIVPAIVIWIAAFSSVINLIEYYRKIKHSPDGRAFAYIAGGITLFGGSMPFTALLSRVLQYGAQQGTINQSLVTIINTHIAALLYLAGFVCLYIGSQRLIRIVKAKVHPVQTNISIALLAIISLLYVFGVFLNPIRETSNIAHINATYAMPDWLTLLTIVLPYVVTWGLGFYTILSLYTYQKRVKGKIYKQSLKYLTVGLIGVIGLSIILQLLTTASTILFSWAVSAILALIYILLLVMAFGYLYIARGAKGLSKLEDVT